MSQCGQRRTEPRLLVTCIINLVKVGRVLLKKLLARGPTNSQTKQTHKHSHHNNPIPSLGEVNFFRPNPTHSIAIPSGGSRTGWGKASWHRYGAFFAREKYRQRHSLYVWQFVTTRNVTFYFFVLLHTFSRTLHATLGVCTISADTFRFWLWIPARLFLLIARVSIQYDLHYWKLWWLELSANSTLAQQHADWSELDTLVLTFEHSENCKL